MVSYGNDREVEGDDELFWTSSPTTRFPARKQGSALFFRESADLALKEKQKNKLERRGGEFMQWFQESNHKGIEALKIKSQCNSLCSKGWGTSITLEEVKKCIIDVKLTLSSHLVFEG